MNAHVDNPQVRDWIDRAWSARILDVAIAPPVSAKLKRNGCEYIGPCPRCQGVDRFSINVSENVFNCRGSEGGKGPIALVMHGIGCSFLEAVETITGERRPNGARDESAAEKAEREARDRARQTLAVEKASQAEREATERRRRDEEAVADVLRRAVPIEGTHAEAYLRARGLTPSRRLTVDLKFAELDYWGAPEGEGARKVLLATLPAMVAIIRNAAGEMIGLHQTYLDMREPRKWAPIGSKENKPKKIRGAAKGGMIWLGKIGEKLGSGEGIESTLSWFQLGHGPEDVTLAAAISLGNLAGSCTGSKDHPTLVGTDGKPTKIRNGIPDMSRPGVILPEIVREVILIGDGDSEPVSTRVALMTAARRFVAEGRAVDVHFAPGPDVWPPKGADFNNVLMAQRAEMNLAA